MQNFIENFKEALEIEDYEVNPEDKFRDYEEWDSLAVLALLAMINEEYNLIIPRKEFEKLITIKDIFNYLNKR
jgi:acyl carrier protein